MYRQRDWVKWRRGGEWVDNDEGYHWKFCHSCRRRTEHELQSCLSCENLRRKNT